MAPTNVWSLANNYIFQRGATKWLFVLTIGAMYPQVVFPKIEEAWNVYQAPGTTQQAVFRDLKKRVEERREAGELIEDE